jgi:chlorite dismutase
MFYLMKSTGWTESELRAFMINHFSKSHWNLLNKKERRAVIAMLQNYIKQNEKKAKNTSNKETSNGHPQDPQG